MPPADARGSLSIRPASIHDVALVRSLIAELAEYERLSHEMTATDDQLARWLFCDKPMAEVLVAEWDSQPVAFALFFHNFSTFLAKPGIHLEDLFVRPAYRNLGVGKALLRQLAALAVQRGCGRLEWAVLDWNQPAIGFYKRLGAIPMNEWTVFRITGEALETLATNRP